ncbi:MAG: serine protease [Patescibacteria group bacterium]
MSFLKPYLSILLALFAMAVIIFSDDVSVTPDTTVPLPVASSTVSVIPTSPAPTMATEDAKTTEVATTTPEATTPKKIEKAEPPKIIAPIIKDLVPVVVPVPVVSTVSGNALLDMAATTLRGALVNIICYVPYGSSLHSISGSGIMIDAQGIILTNAHIAQYFLLADRNVSCTIRAGNPAVNKYKAALIYISPAWVRANATILTQTTPIGTGEYDYALLAVTKSATNDPLPPAFPFITLAQTPPSSGAPVIIASYGAQFLESSQIQSALYPTIVFGSIKDVYTFAVNTIDVLALGGSAAAQEGSSGGGVADMSGLLVGTITTSTISGATDTRSLSAITASYIRAQYAREMGSSLDTLLSQPTAVSIANFATQIPALESIITANLP